MAQNNLLKRKLYKTNRSTQLPNVIKNKFPLDFSTFTNKKLALKNKCLKFVSASKHLLEQVLQKVSKPAKNILLKSHTKRSFLILLFFSNTGFGFLCFRKRIALKRRLIRWRVKTPAGSFFFQEKNHATSFPITSGFQSLGSVFTIFDENLG